MVDLIRDFHESKTMEQLDKPIPFRERLVLAMRQYADTHLEPAKAFVLGPFAVSEMEEAIFDGEFGESLRDWLVCLPRNSLACRLAHGDVTLCGLMVKLDPEARDIRVEG